MVYWKQRNNILKEVIFNNDKIIPFRKSRYWKSKLEKIIYWFYGQKKDHNGLVNPFSISLKNFQNQINLKI
jgi:hypothetical protein